jgi:hypothetical protein
VRVGTLLPKLLKVPKRLWYNRMGYFVPIIFDIEKFTANGTGVQDFFDSELFSARRIDALLINRHADILRLLR